MIAAWVRWLRTFEDIAMSWSFNGIQKYDRGGEMNL